MPLSTKNTLSLKLLQAVLIAALVVGLILSIAQIIIDAYSARQQMANQANDVLAMVKDPATQAIYNLDRDVAQQVIEGLFENIAIRQASIGHPDEPPLAEKERPLKKSSNRWFTDNFFGSEQIYQTELIGYSSSNGKLAQEQTYSEYYGDLTITFDTYITGSEFLQRSIIIFVTGILRAILMATVLYLIYYLFLTKPLENLLINLKKISPGNPEKQQLEIIKGHENDELGIWINLTNKLLHGIHEHNEKRSEAEAHVVRLAQYDSLTGLPNRSMLQKLLEELIHEEGGNNKLVAVHCCGIDDFTSINEQHNYQTGDELLLTFSERIHKQAPDDCFMARLGGDQFAIIQKNLNHPYEAARLAQTLLDRLNDPFNLTSARLHVNATIGITLFPGDGDNAQKLLQKAEQTMSLAKKNNRSHYQFYVASVDKEMRDRKQLEKDLTHALERHQLHMVYQPQVDMKTLRIVGAEALLRWKHPSRGMIPPDLFIPLAENNKSIIQIGEWVLDTACADTKQWHKLGFNDLQIAVNLSAVQLQHRKIDQTISNILKKHQFPAELLELEITETSVMDNIEAAIECVVRVKKTGIKFAIDDFGTGYSSLSYLKRLPLDKIKIDKSFVQDLFDEEDDTSIVNAIIQLGSSLHMEVIAEGVETKEHERYLQQHHCDYGQGYLYSKPATHEDFIELLKTQPVLDNRR